MAVVDSAGAGGPLPAALAGAPPVAAERAARRARRLRWLRSNPGLLVFGGILAILVLVGLLAPLLAPYDPLQTRPAAALQPPSGAHPMGTDSLGRDTLSRVIWGARVSLGVAVIAVSIALCFGVSLGLLAGYRGGFTDDVFSRFVDALLAFPGILLAIAITNALGPSLANAMIAIGIINIPTYFRLTRGQVLQAREHDFVTAARVLGASHLRIVTRHILPNILNPLIVAASIAAAGAILAVAALSFIGLGAQPPTPDWGSMINAGAGYLSQAPWLAFAPGVAISLTVFSSTMFGDALRDALDPRLRNR